MANIYLYANNAASSLLGNVNPTDTSIALPNGAGARFPSPNAGQSFLLTLEDTVGNVEIVEVTGRTNDVLTVVRGREGTSARVFSASTPVEARVTAGMLGYLDWQSVAGKPNGTVKLNSNSMVPTEVLGDGVRAIGDPRYNPLLGYTPVQQSGGVSQATNKIYIGLYSDPQNPVGETNILCQVDATPLRMLTSSRIGNLFGGVVQLSHPRMYATSLAGTEDRIYLGGHNDNNLGSSGWYFFGRGVDHGVFAAGPGEAWRYTYATQTFNVVGRFTQNGTPVSIQGHTHVITDVGGLLDALNSKAASNSDVSFNNVTVAGQMSAGSVIDRSDSRVKDIKRTMSAEESEAIVRGLRPVVYHDKLANNESIGFVADEAENYVPQLVPVDGMGMRGLMYQRLTAPITAVLQALLTERDLTRARLFALESK